MSSLKWLHKLQESVATATLFCSSSVEIPVNNDDEFEHRKKKKNVFISARRAIVYAHDRRISLMVDVVIFV